MKKYKAVPGPKSITVDNGKIANAFNSFADIINAECVGGWEYHSMQSIQVVEKPGCKFFGQPVAYTYYMLIFVKEEN